MTFVRSRAFRSRLAEAARNTRRTGHETGFELYRDRQHGADYLTPVVEGLTDHIPGGAYDDWARQTLPEWPARYGDDLFTLHFHPEDYGYTRPSIDDLQNIDHRVTEVDLIKGYATVSNGGVGTVLFVQKTCNGYLSTGDNKIAEELNDLCVDAEEREASHEVPRLLESTGYLRAQLVPFYLVQRSRDAAISVPAGLARFYLPDPAAEDPITFAKRELPRSLWSEYL